MIRRGHDDSGTVWLCGGAGKVNCDLVQVEGKFGIGLLSEVSEQAEGHCN